MLVSQTVEFIYALVAGARRHRFVKVEVVYQKKKVEVQPCIIYTGSL